MAGIRAGAPRWLLIAGASVPGRSHDLTPILTEAGFTNLSRIEAQPADETTIYYGPDFDDVTADVAAHFGLPASKVQAEPGGYSVQLCLGHRLHVRHQNRGHCAVRPERGCPDRRGPEVPGCWWLR